MIAPVVYTASNSTNAYGAYSLAPLTPEQQRRRFLESKRESALASLAKVKAEDLLRSCLSRKQLEELVDHDHFHVPVPSQDGSVKVYRICRGFARNVFLLDERGEPKAGFCIHPRANVPAADSMLSQKLLLEADEGRFLKIANQFSVRR